MKVHIGDIYIRKHKICKVDCSSGDGCSCDGDVDECIGNGAD